MMFLVHFHFNDMHAVDQLYATGTFDLPVVDKVLIHPRMQGTQQSARYIHQPSELAWSNSQELECESTNIGRQEFIRNRFDFEL